MIKLKLLLKEMSITDNDVFTYAKSKGYSYLTYRGDTDADQIFSYGKKERREYGIFTTTVKEIAAKYSKNKNPRKFYVRAPKLLDLTNDTIQNMKWVQKWGESFDEWIDRQRGHPALSEFQEV